MNNKSDNAPNITRNHAEEIANIITESNHIVIIQADNPDADSLASALALEQILEETGKQTSLYCGVDMPGYLKYMDGWDRVSSLLPSDFDCSIIVDTSTLSLLERLTESGDINRLKSKKCIVIDHHKETDNNIGFAEVVLIDSDKSSTGDIVYHLAIVNNWPLDKYSAEYIMNSILGDTQGLTNEHATSETYTTMADLIKLGANRPALEESRRKLNKMEPEIFRYKADLISRTEFYDDGRIAIVVISHDEIIKYSPLYNPNALIQPEHLQTTGVGISIAMKHYPDGKITGSIRSNSGNPVAGKLAEFLGGGGHAHASGFKITNGQKLEDVKKKTVAKCIEYLEQLKAESK